MSRKMQSQENYYYNHDFLGCTASLDKDGYSLICEVKENWKGCRSYESYVETFYKNGIMLAKSINKGKFPTETGLLERKMYYYQNKVKKEGIAA